MKYNTCPKDYCAYNVPLSTKATLSTVYLGNKMTAHSREEQIDKECMAREGICSYEGEVHKDHSDIEVSELSNING